MSPAALHPKKRMLEKFGQGSQVEPVATLQSGTPTPRLPPPPPLFPLPRPHHHANHPQLPPPRLSPLLPPPLSPPSPLPTSSSSSSSSGSSSHYPPSPLPSSSSSSSGSSSHSSPSPSCCKRRSWDQLKKDLKSKCWYVGSAQSPLKWLLLRRDYS